MSWLIRPLTDRLPAEEHEHHLSVELSLHPVIYHWTLSAGLVAPFVLLQHHGHQNNTSSPEACFTLSLWFTVSFKSAIFLLIMSHIYNYSSYYYTAVVLRYNGALNDGPLCLSDTISLMLTDYNAILLLSFMWWMQIFFQFRENKLNIQFFSLTVQILWKMPKSWT